MELIKKSEIEFLPNKFGLKVKRLLNRESVGIMNIYLDPGQQVAPHSVPVDVFFFVAAGSGKITIGDETAPVEPDDIVICPAGVEMSISAGDDGLEVFNVKTPNYLVPLN